MENKEIIEQQAAAEFEVKIRPREKNLLFDFLLNFPIIHKLCDYRNQKESEDKINLMGYPESIC